MGCPFVGHVSWLVQTLAHAVRYLEGKQALGYVLKNDVIRRVLFI